MSNLLKHTKSGFSPRQSGSKGGVLSPTACCFVHYLPNLLLKSSSSGESEANAEGHCQCIDQCWGSDCQRSVSLDFLTPPQTNPLLVGGERDDKARAFALSHIKSDALRTSCSPKDTKQLSPWPQGDPKPN